MHDNEFINGVYVITQVGFYPRVIILYFRLKPGYSHFSEEAKFHADFMITLEGVILELLSNVSVAVHIILSQLTIYPREGILSTYI